MKKLLISFFAVFAIVGVSNTGYGLAKKVETLNVSYHAKINDAAR